MLKTTTFKINTLIAVSILGLSACGGGSNSSFVKPVILDGIFKDSNVSGLSFVSGGENGVTDKDGKFTYEKGEEVKFSLGGVDLGSGVGKTIMTPLDLVENGSLNSTEVINKVRFLMMLDENNNPTDGIQFSKKVLEKAEEWKNVEFKAFNFTSPIVNSIVVGASVADGVEHTLPTREAAVKHLRTTLLCSNAGAYVGSYKGTEKGNIALMVNPVTGAVKGSSYNPENQVSVEVKDISPLDYDKGLKFIAMEDSAKKFSGSLQSTDELEGTWVNSADAKKKGSFSGLRKGGKSDAIYRYTVAFTGGDKGLFTFDVNKSNKVTGLVYSVSTKKESALSGKIVDNKLTVTSTEGDELTGFIVKDTLAITGVWINGPKQTNGNFDGGGCRLN